jgi:hypothetical protein
MRPRSSGPRVGDPHTDVGPDVGDTGAVGVTRQDRDPAIRVSSCARARDRPDGKADR